ncbi:YfkD family protein [Cytobacillus sp. Hm23]
MKRISQFIVLLFFMSLINPNVISAEEKKKAAKNQYVMPDSVVNISKENTYPNPTEDLPYLEPSELAKKLIETSNVTIENPDLIRILNESSIGNAPHAIGYRATIFLGEWPLNYESQETTTNWEYQKINTNYFDNRGGEAPQKIFYTQDTQKVVKGGLTSNVPNEEDVKKMMLLKSMDKTKLQLSFQTIVGLGTKKEQVYNIPPKKVGYLYSHSPAVNEKGKVTYGEVYLVLRGNSKRIEVKNVTSQGIGAWIPVQDHVSFSFVTTNHPR